MEDLYEEPQVYHPCDIYPYRMVDCDRDCEHCTIGNPYFDYGED